MSQDEPDIVFSFRIAESSNEVDQLEAGLKLVGLKTFRCDQVPNSALFPVIIGEKLDQCKVVVIMGSRTYGTRTTGGFSTFEELGFVLSEGKRYYLVKMCDRFELPEIRLMIPPGIRYTRWLPGDQIPSGLIREIENAVRNPAQSPALHINPNSNSQDSSEVETQSDDDGEDQNLLPLVNENSPLLQRIRPKKISLLSLLVSTKGFLLLVVLLAGVYGFYFVSASMFSIPASSTRRPTETPTEYPTRIPTTVIPTVQPTPPFTSVKPTQKSTGVPTIAVTFDPKNKMCKSASVGIPSTWMCCNAIAIRSDDVWLCCDNSLELATEPYVSGNQVTDRCCPGNWTMERLRTWTNCVRADQTVFVPT
jgi:hypothetical protein